jgi:arginyl-tRNA synthetase
MLGREERYHFDKMIYVVASQQELHFAQLFQLVKAMGPEEAKVSAKCQHISFGMVKGMSTRKGNVKFLDDILRDVGETMFVQSQKSRLSRTRHTDPF